MAKICAQGVLGVMSVIVCMLHYFTALSLFVYEKNCTYSNYMPQSYHKILSQFHKTPIQQSVEKK